MNYINMNTNEIMDRAKIHRYLSDSYTYIKTNITALRTRCFRYSNNLKTLSMLNVRTIEGLSVADCPLLETVVIGHQCSYISSQAFTNCPKLKTVICLNPTPVNLIYADVFDGTPIITDKTGYIYVRDDALDAYKASTKWANFVSQIKPLSEYTGKYI